MSIYKQGSVSADVLGSGIKTIANAFPELPKGWYDVLKDMMKDEGFDNERFSAAVKNLVKNCIYPKPTIANMLSYDKTVKIFNYIELLEHTENYSPQTREEYLNSYDKVDFYGVLKYAKKEDVVRFNLPLWKK